MTASNPDWLNISILFIVVITIVTAVIYILKRKRVLMSILVIISQIVVIFQLFIHAVGREPYHSELDIFWIHFKKKELYTYIIIALQLLIFGWWALIFSNIKNLVLKKYNK